MIWMAILGLVVGIGLAVLGVMAATDPEGRGTYYVMAGCLGLVLAVVCLLYLLYRLTVYLLGGA